MPIYRSAGIVIGRTNFGEADRIIRFITPEHGKLSAVAKGVRKIKSRMSGHLEPFSDTELQLASGRNLDVITSARLLWYPHDLVTDYAQVEFAYALATSIDRLVEADHPQPGLYDVTKQALHALNSSGASAILELWFKLRLLDCLGYHPELNGCLVCSRHGPDEQYFFDVERGGVVCLADSNSDNPTFSISAIKLWRLMIDYPFLTIAAITDGPAIAETTLPLVNTFFEFHLGYSFTAH